MSTIEVEINPCSRAVLLDPAPCERALRQICQAEGCHGAHFSIAVVDDTLSRMLHRKYLQQDSPTDVLSFLLDRKEREVEGEIIVNAEVALRRAPQYHWQPEDELLLYVVHGGLHLFGYDDRQEADRERMFGRQRELFQQLGYDAGQVATAVRLPA